MSMKRISKLLILPIIAMSISGCGLFDEIFGEDTDTIHKKSFEPITGKFVLYENADKRYEYHDTYFDINGSKGNFSLKYYENGELKKQGSLNRIVTYDDKFGKWMDNLHFNVNIGGRGEHICTYTESLTEINQFRIIMEYYGDEKYYLSELPYVMGTYVREGKEYKKEDYHTNEHDTITPTLENFTNAFNGFYKLDEDHYFYFLNPQGFTVSGNLYESYFQYFSSELEKPLEGFVSGHSYENEPYVLFKYVRDLVDWGKEDTRRINFGYSTFDEEDNMIDHDGTVDFSDGELHSFTFEHLSRHWSELEWKEFITKPEYHLPDAILYDYVGGTYVKAK